ncbi:RND family efflux transporter MFP subunit [Kerstersia gyiorum]|nr:RND family efflux transporter MFP subunit [Kerstersia gyiorum]MCP1825240.1 RND family efflux transporter MFP subunit [Kerstersia gyiorum]MCP1828658.1 RND family efflux transporter MFP subunit [Kerstersia gyiorum]MCW2452281.1 RND family efflux transporter MFP subunit [Kerstersia gyiorum]
MIAEENYPHSGTLVSVDNQLDTRSGTLRMRALLPNTDGVMIPGLQARVRLQTGEPYRAVLIDEAVIGTDQDRRFVLVVDGQGQVERRILTLGSRQGTQRVVLQGLRAADLVIVDGAQRVQPGQKVKADVPPGPGVDEGVRD